MDRGTPFSRCESRTPVQRCTPHPPPWKPFVLSRGRSRGPRKRTRPLRTARRFCLHLVDFAVPNGSLSVVREQFVETNPAHLLTVLLEGRGGNWNMFQGVWETSNLIAENTFKGPSKMCTSAHVLPSHLGVGARPRRCRSPADRKPFRVPACFPVGRAWVSPW